MEMAKIRRTRDILSDTSEGRIKASSSYATAAALHRQPAALGKLQEVDLGPSVTSLNVSRTEAAERRVRGEAPEAEELSCKARLGKN